MRTARNYHATIVAGVLVAVLLAVSIAWSLASPPANGELKARIHDAAGQTHVLNLSEDTRLTVETELGTNVVTVENGAVRIVEADCPNGDCMRQQAISEPGQQLICLPHRLWIEISADGDEGEMDLSAVSPEEAGASPDVDLVAR